MNRLSTIASVRTSIVALLTAWAFWIAPGLASVAIAQQDTAPAAAAPKLYGFCMEMHDARKRTLPEQAAMLRELGFDGVGYPLWLDDQLWQNLAELDRAGLPVYLMYASASVAPDKPAYDERLEAAIRRLRGRPTTVGITLRGLPPGDPRGMDAAVKTLRRLGDVAAEAGLQDLALPPRRRLDREPAVYARGRRPRRSSAGRGEFQPVPLAEDRRRPGLPALAARTCGEDLSP
jgi:hypothetical protein